jgi:hypothetical protein
MNKNFMNLNLFDRQNLTEMGFVVKEEEFPNELKSKRALYVDESCDGFFEILQGQLRREGNCAELNLNEIFAEVIGCKLVYKTIIILGEYDSKSPNIKYYRQTPEQLEIIKIHERFHAIHHLMHDSSGKEWEEFPDINSFYLELLAQLFTYIYVRDFEPSLLADFEDLNKSQPFIYKTFKIFSHYDQFQAKELYWIIREKKHDQFGYQFLEELFYGIRLKTINDAVFDGIRKTINRFREQPFLYFTESDIHASLSKDIMDGSSDILILGNTAVERKTILTPVSLVHHEYPTNFRYEKRTLKDGYDESTIHQTSISSTHGDRGNYDLAILNPYFIEKLFETHKQTGLIEILKHIINKDVIRAIVRGSDLELIYAIEVKFVHMFNDRNIQMLEEVKSDNEKLRLAIHNKHCEKAINLIFCSSSEKDRRDQKDPVIKQIKDYIDQFNSQDIINIFIESYIDKAEGKKTPKPRFSANQNGWSEFKTTISKQ